jgi:hypothetical protein
LAVSGPTWRRHSEQIVRFCAKQEPPLRGTSASCGFRRSSF